MTRKKDRDSMPSGFKTSTECEGCGFEIKDGQPRYTVLHSLSDALVAVLRTDYYHPTCLDSLALIMWLPDGEAITIYC